MPVITKLMLQNFKQFGSLTLDFDSGTNVLIGDNETGKSTVLIALDLAMSASRSRIETIGFEALINREAVRAFLNGPRGIDNLPKVIVDVFLQEGDEEYLYGAQNLTDTSTDGLRMKIAPVDEYHPAILQVLADDPQNFPYEYYAVTFFTFSGAPLTSYRRPVKHLHLDSSRIDGEYAAREYTRTVFGFHAEVGERYRLENLYRRGKEVFREDQLAELNKKLPPYEFGLRTSIRSNLETDLVITKEGIPIENRGKGEQCFIKTEFALGKHEAQGGLQALLLEEPENHLSHTNMKRLVERLASTADTQLFIATHSSHICSRLDLRHALLLGTNQNAGKLKALSEKTAGFFMKAPDNNVLEFALSKKVILVEGDAEYILIEELYKKVSGGNTPQADQVHIISIGGTSFKRYLELAKLLNIKVAAIRDNDHDYQQNCVENYKEHTSDKAKIFADPDNARSTFEIGLYQDNQAACDDLFAGGRKKLTVQEYMLKNKADVAFELLQKKSAELVAPKYIKEAIEWIRE
ncbi:ATP-dependent endonuclease [Pseudomonas sp. CF161]|uniref:ATP-dependent nuclease n=1 Tax=Pseudomonas sp. CF161 TaxID=911241 RepID=UPI00035506D4|nr:TOPRIM nucleotidyl transferase/hydrolase domain-containing protein [Pseudomonas sp. CF161]EPL16051.1 putative ATP-dependent endonuclease of the OLD family [Pseudomonas sp. CF161]